MEANRLRGDNRLRNDWFKGFTAATCQSSHFDPGSWQHQFSRPRGEWGFGLGHHPDVGHLIILDDSCGAKGSRKAHHLVSLGSGHCPTTVLVVMNASHVDPNAPNALNALSQTPHAPVEAATAAATATVAQALCSALHSVMVDQDQAIRLTVAGLLSGGHVLLEGPPGVGKTTLAKALVSACGSGFARVQGTADLLPADITGANIFDQRTSDWAFRPGPLMQHVVLFDEINRATPRAQSALLEAMAERQVSVDGIRHALPDPFFLIATQNPSGDLGTYPLVAGQRDRFALVATVGRPSREAERKILTQLAPDRVATMAAVTSPMELRAAIAGVSACHVDGRLVDYLLDIVEAVRTAGASAGITTSLGPRASQTMLAVSRALGAIGGRTFVVPDDIKHAAPAVLAHRMMRPGDDRLTTLAEWVAAVTDTVRAP